MKTIRLSEIVIRKLRPVFRDRIHSQIIITSGRAGTKSSMTAILAAFRIVMTTAGSVVILRKRHNKLRSTVYREALRAISRLCLSRKLFRITVNPMRITYLANGNTIYFAGSDNPDDTKGIIDETGKPIITCIIDEASDFFISGGQGADELQNIEATFVRGNSSGNFQMIYCFNPPKNPNAGVNVWTREMEKRSDCKHIHVTYLDVPPEWLGDALIQSAETLKQADYRQYRWLWLGEAIGVDDLIYYMFSAARHVSKPARKAYGNLYIGVDYGQMNATTFQAFGLNHADHCLDGLAEYYHSGRDGVQKSPSEYGKDFAAFVLGLAGRFECGVVYVYIDPSAKGLAEEIKRATRGIGVTVLIRDAKNDVALGISRVQRLLTFGLIRFAPQQANAIREFGVYEYDPKSIERGDEKPVKTDDHAMDAIRYVTMGAWSKLKPFLPADKEDKA